MKKDLSSLKFKNYDALLSAVIYTEKRIGELNGNIPKGLALSKKCKLAHKHIKKEFE